MPCLGYGTSGADNVSRWKGGLRRAYVEMGAKRKSKEKKEMVRQRECKKGTDRGRCALKI